MTANIYRRKINVFLSNFQDIFKDFEMQMFSIVPICMSMNLYIFVTFKNSSIIKILAKGEKLSFYVEMIMIYVVFYNKLSLFCSQIQYNITKIVLLSDNKLTINDLQFLTNTNIHFP